MALSKEELLQILGGLDESNLVKALGAVGVKIDGGQGGMSLKDGVMQDDTDTDNEGLASWNATKVVAPAGSRPPIFDKQQTVDQPQVQAQPAQRPQRSYMDHDAPDAQIAPFAANA